MTTLVNLLPKVRFTLDIGHCLQNEDDFLPFIKKHSSRIENIHLICTTEFPVEEDICDWAPES